jgi:hypothetical protein
MPSKLETFLTQNKIDTRVLLVASKKIEALRPEDRAVKLAKRVKAEGEKSKETRKPRSGRPVSPVALARIFAEKAVNGPTRTRVLRAVNAVLERKKKPVVDLGALFDLSIKQPKKKPVAKKDARKK